MPTERSKGLDVWRWTKGGALKRGFVFGAFCRGLDESGPLNLESWTGEF